MKYILSRYNHLVDWVSEYSDDVILYDRSPEKLTGTPEMLVIPMKNLGSDISDKFAFIIENYRNLPDVAVYSKANLFKYCPKDEFDLLKNNKTFTPLLSSKHIEKEGICRYNEGIYEELNNYWYLNPHPCKSEQTKNELIDLLGLRDRQWLRFAPGSNYILPKENILKHPKEFYIKLKSYLDLQVYGGESQLTERALYYLWK